MIRLLFSCAFSPKRQGIRGKRGRSPGTRTPAGGNGRGARDRMGGGYSIRSHASSIQYVRKTSPKVSFFVRNSRDPESVGLLAVAGTIRQT